MNVKEKITALRSLMCQNNIDLYYIPTDDDHMSEYIGDHFKCRSYMSGFTGSAGFLVVGHKEAGLWTDGRYFTQAEKQLKNSGIKLFKMGMAKVPTVFEYIVDNCPQGGCVGFDGKVVNAKIKDELAAKLTLKQAKIKADEDLVDQIWQDRPAMPCSEAFILDDKYTGMSIAKKIAKVQDDIKAAGCEALIVSSLEDVAWLFNLRGDDIAHMPVNYAYALVEVDRVRLYIAEAKITKDVKEKLEKAKVSLCAYEALAQDLKMLKMGKIWIDKAKLNAYLYNHITQEIYNEANPIVMYRAIKNAVEIKNTKNAHVKDGVAMTKFIYWLKSNVGKFPMDEISVQNKLYELRAEGKGYIEPSFATICAYKGNAAMMHYSANETSNASLDNSGFLLVDSGGTYFEGTTDITRTICLGKVSDKDRFYYTTVLRAMLNLMGAKFLYGTTGANLDILARGICWQHDIDYQCGTGHGVGHVLSVHEGPHNIRWGKGPAATIALEEGMIVTDEPGIYIPDVIGIRIENELLVCKGTNNEYGQFMHFEPLTLCPIDMDALDVSLMNDREIALLNAYHEQVYKQISPYLDEEHKLWLKTQTRKVVR